MKLLDPETGIEYEVSIFQSVVTGKRYEVRAGFGDYTTQFITTINDKRRLIDTHRAICFLEPLEKVEPMPVKTLEERVADLERLINERR